MSAALRLDEVDEASLSEPDESDVFSLLGVSLPIAFLLGAFLLDVFFADTFSLSDVFSFSSFSSLEYDADEEAGVELEMEDSSCPDAQGESWLLPLSDT